MVPDCGKSLNGSVHNSRLLSLYVMLGVRDCHCHFKTIYWFSYEEEPGIKIKENIKLSNLQRKKIRRKSNDF